MTRTANNQNEKWAETTRRHLEAAQAPVYVKVNHSRHTASIVECDLFTHDNGTEVRYIISHIETGAGGLHTTERVYNDFDAAAMIADKWQCYRQ